MWLNPSIGSNEAPELRRVIESGIHIFDDSWCTHVPTHKTVLQNKIIRRYYFNQIGSSTPDRFVHYLNEHLARIMPYYNQLYASELIKVDPMINYYLHTEGTDLNTIVREANNVASKVGKKLRNFVLSDAVTQNITGNVKGSLEDSIDKKVDGSYNKSGTDDIAENTDIANKTATESTGQKITANEDTKKTTGSTETDTTETMTDSTSNVTRYSDTPQQNLATGAVNVNYLTNYTEVTGSETRDTVGKTASTMSEDVAGTFDGKEDTASSSTEDFTGEEDRTLKKDWNEQGSDTEISKTSQTQGTTTDSTEDTDRKHFETHRDDYDTADAESGESKETEAGEKKNEVDSKGLINISASDLLEAFRRTFLNIDEMIINELRDNFMEIY